MKSYLFGSALFLFSIQSFSAETDWVRIGQVNNFVVDINRLSTVKSNESVTSVARLLPRSSRPDIEAMGEKVFLTEVKPIFFTLVQATYNCVTKEVSAIKETNFDTNVLLIGESGRLGFSVVPDEYDLIQKYLCKK